MEFLNIGGGELLALILLAIVLFGPEDIMGLMRTIGKFARNVQQMWVQVSQGINLEEELLADAEIRETLEDAKASVDEVKETLTEVKAAMDTSTEEITEELTVEVPPLTIPAESEKAAKPASGEETTSVAEEATVALSVDRAVESTAGAVGDQTAVVAKEERVVSQPISAPEEEMPRSLKDIINDVFAGPKPSLAVEVAAATPSAPRAEASEPALVEPEEEIGALGWDYKAAIQFLQTRKETVVTPKEETLTAAAPTSAQTIIVEEDA